MKIQIKDLANMIQNMNPEAYIEVAGGHCDYGTQDVELVERDGVVSIQEASETKRHNYHVVDMPFAAGGAMDRVIVFKSRQCALSDLYFFFEKEFSGTIVIDQLLTVGNNDNRFLKAAVKDGKLDVKSVEILTLLQNNSIREYTSNIVAENRTEVMNSILRDYEKTLLLKGLSV